MKFAYVATCVLGFAFNSLAVAQEQRPNILWLSAEDISPHFGCYGDQHAKTPTVDQIAREGIVYTKVFTTAGVCAPCRSGIITGVHQTTLGTQHMRSTATLPANVRPFPIYLREAGYYCTNNAKEDYQFKTPPETWDVSSGQAHWRTRPNAAQPFFAVFNYTGCHESGIANKEKYLAVTANLSPDKRQSPERLEIPPYHPDTPTVREDWKRNYELISAFDEWCAAKIQENKDAGLYEDTIIMIWSDHGVGLPRSKRWVYDSGTHVPLVIRIPTRFRDVSELGPGSQDDQLVSSIDFGPTVLNLAKVEIPDTMQGRAFLGETLTPEREYVHSARDRMDERYDIIRSVRNQRFLYVRNYEPLKNYYQYMNSPESGATMKELRRLHDAGKLPAAAEYYFNPSKPVEELYDCEEDPHNITNLADQPQYEDVLDELRNEHLAWVKRTRDTGLIPEPILRERARKIGSEYQVLREPGSELLMQRIASAAINASEGISALPALLDATNDTESEVRYWGATGLGNIGDELADDRQVIKVLGALLEDPSSTVRTTAARGLCRLNQPKNALPVLVHEMTTGAQWERLYAAIALDELDEIARPVVESMKEGLRYEKGFNSEGKYRVRVINRALNELNGTEHKVK